MPGAADQLERHYGGCSEAPDFVKNCSLRTAKHWPPFPASPPTQPEAAPGVSGAAPTPEEYDPPEEP